MDSACFDIYHPVLSTKLFAYLTASLYNLGLWRASAVWDGL